MNVCVISILICYGIYRHRNGFREMDNASECDPADMDWILLAHAAQLQP